MLTNIFAIHFFRHTFSIYVTFCACTNPEIWGRGGLCSRQFFYGSSFYKAKICCLLFPFFKTNLRGIHKTNLRGIQIPDSHSGSVYVVHFFTVGVYTLSPFRQICRLMDGSESRDTPKFSIHRLCAGSILVL